MLRKKIALSPQDRRNLDINKSTLWYMKKNQNDGKPYSEIVKPYDSILIGNAYKKDRKTGVPIVPFVPKNENLDETPFGEFVDYKSGILYPNSDSFDSREYWKPMSVTFSEYRNNDSSNALKRRLVFGKESIKYVGKEINELETSTYLVFQKTILLHMRIKMKRFVE